eukprot:9142428-Pyramimonas_sp.AAC.1
MRLQAQEESLPEAATSPGPSSATREVSGPTPRTHDYARDSCSEEAKSAWCRMHACGCNQKLAQINDRRHVDVGERNKGASGILLPRWSAKP